MRRIPGHVRASVGDTLDVAHVGVVPSWPQESFSPAGQSRCGRARPQTRHQALSQRVAVLQAREAKWVQGIGAHVSWMCWWKFLRMGSFVSTDSVMSSSTVSSARSTR